MQLMEVAIYNSTYSLLPFALVQSMTDSCSYFSMWRVFDTLSSRGFAIPTLRSRWSLSMGLLRFSLFEAAKNQSFIKLEPYPNTILQPLRRQDLPSAALPHAWW